MPGRVCAKHQEYSPTGECRWCEPAAALPRKTVHFVPLAGAPTAANQQAAQAISDWADGLTAVALPGLNGSWRPPDRTEFNAAGVPTYTWDLGTFPIRSTTGGHNARVSVALPDVPPSATVTPPPAASRWRGHRPAPTRDVCEACGKSSEEVTAMPVNALCAPPAVGWPPRGE